MDILSQLQKIAEISPSKKEPSRNQDRHDEIVKAYRNAFITKRMTAKQLRRYNMAATKKSIAIKGQKQELANGILFLNAQILECANKVPPIVLNRSHQIAVAWKEVAESVFKRELSGAPSSMTAEALRVRLAKKTQILKKLKGEGLLT